MPPAATGLIDSRCPLLLKRFVEGRDSFHWVKSIAFFYIYIYMALLSAPTAMSEIQTWAIRKTKICWTNWICARTSLSSSYFEDICVPEKSLWLRYIDHWLCDRAALSESRVSQLEILQRDTVFHVKMHEVSCSNTNCFQKIQTHKRLKRTLFIWTKHNMRIFMVVPFF